MTSVRPSELNQAAQPPLRFNPPPGWPACPDGWRPPAGWTAPASWAPAPADWRFWVPAADTATQQNRLGPTVRADPARVAVPRQAGPTADPAGLVSIRGRIRTAMADGSAVSSSGGWQIDGSGSEGAKLIEGLAHLVLRSYTIEAEDCVRMAASGTAVATAVARLHAVADEIESLGELFGIRIDADFHELRLEEIRIAAGGPARSRRG